MRKLADELGVEAMSLYHHIQNKDALVSEMVDYVVPTIPPLDECKDWKDGMRIRADIMQKTLEKHPWVAQEFVSGINVGPNMLQYIETTIGYLLESGFSYKMTDYTWNVIDSYVYGFNLQRQNFPLEPSEFMSAAEQFLPMIPMETHPNMHNMSRAVIEGSHDGLQDFNFGLDIILDGIDRIHTNENKEKK